ncbi:MULTISPECIES: DUF3885 domain-containing protein [Lysinibacillus]|uniref:DUF3885 domain-containing protein n=1 Tax=Lysinibacillus TaxID=400634 RepID=UPI00056C3AF9|nr:MULTISPECIES: DUF3885 domain-containing protein [Lysinibacillus]MEE3808726.1 DUF3885 domain-containing protein [Lysinibacillus fusiformis]SCY22580.1 protein of unknown function [Lysinibacillus sp. SG9]SDB09664.1 protein of unknown function [Lysinibacillus sp. TC-37]SFS44952.1 protein of unknown function [Lysinibacillus sp. SG55]
MLLNDYMNENFPSLLLRPPLFYNWEIGIRFELGVERARDCDYEDRLYIQEVYKRAVTLFEALHLQDEEIFMVVDVNDFGGRKTYQHKARIFSPYIYDKSVLYKLKHTEMSSIFPEDDEDGKYKTHRFTLACKTSDLKYIPLLKAVCNQDLGIQPSIFHRIYFLNIKKKTIFHVYDDRGCDLLATSPESIRDIYYTYNDWILDYDKDKIDKVFK